jgi:Uma2 family endonuclease
MKLVLSDTIRMPAGFANLRAFRRWTRSGNYPEHGDYSYLGGDLWVNLSMETFLHNELTGLFAVIPGGLVRSAELGRFFADRMRLVHEGAGLSCEPDAMFASQKALRTKRVRLAEGAESLEVIGSPDMVLEIVSEHSIQKDTVALRELYAAAKIAEYCLVNPLGEQVSFNVLRLSPQGYAPTRTINGWTKSAVFGKSFRLEAKDSGDELPEYRLLVR